MKLLLLLVCILSIILVAASQQQAGPTDGTTEAIAQDGSTQPTSSSTLAPTILHHIFRPLRQSFSSARQFLRERFRDVRNGVRMTQQQTFGLFMRLYNKTYSPEEIPRRMALFFQRRQMIEDSVKAYREGKLPFAMQENEYTDWDDEELKKLTGVSLPPIDQLEADEREGHQSSLMGYNTSTTPPVEISDKEEDDDEEEDDDDDSKMNVKAERIPVSKDWRTSGCVSTPINQMKCGACYAIATMSVVESVRCLKQVSSPILSPQQIVDCATPRAGYANYGCDGGWPTRVLKYLQDKQVAARETCYPFVRRQQTCRINSVRQTPGCTVNPSVTDGNRVQYKILHNENDILYHVAKTGPVVTVMKASDKFLYYGSGIFDDPSCSNKRDDVDHAIVITGYGKENGVDYWLIKNSWGVKEWGQDGYGKYRRGKNACSIGHWGWVVTG